MEIKQWFKDRFQTLILAAGFLLVAALAFELGQAAGIKKRAPEIRIEEAFAPVNNSLNPPQAQSEPAALSSAKTDQCSGKIKGNISSKGDKTYHMPGSSYYNQTKAEMCFDTEQQALDLGFRKVGK